MKTLLILLLIVSVILIGAYFLLSPKPAKPSVTTTNAPSVQPNIEGATEIEIISEPNEPKIYQVTIAQGLGIQSTP